jgi:hypothetical protein
MDVKKFNTSDPVGFTVKPTGSDIVNLCQFAVKTRPRVLANRKSDIGNINMSRSRTSYGSGFYYQYPISD